MKKFYALLFLLILAACYISADEIKVPPPTIRVGETPPPLGGSLSPLTEEAMNAVGITQTYFDEIKNVGGDSFIGWILREYEHPMRRSSPSPWLSPGLEMIWSDRTVSDFNVLANYLSIPTADRVFEHGIYSAMNDEYELVFYTGWTRLLSAVIRDGTIRLIIKQK